MISTKEQTMSEVVRNEVFICHSNKNHDFIDRLTSALEAAQIDAFVDADDIKPTAFWEKDIHRGIERASNFVFVISPDSVLSEECKKELVYAIDNGKRLIPIVLKEVDRKLIDKKLNALQWIFFQERDNFQESFTKLVEAIKSDLAWEEAHSDLQNQALEWQRKGQDSNDLLRGSGLQEAEKLLAGVSSNKYPKPTELLRQYVQTSREHETRLQNQENERQKREIDSQKRQIKLQRRIRTIISIALVLVGSLAIAAFIQWGIAENAKATAVAERDQKATAQVQAEIAEKIAVVERDLKATEQVKAVNAEGTAVVERDLKATAQVVAETQRDIAISRLARILAADQLDLGLLLAIEASLGSSSDGLTSLFDLLQVEPGLVRIVSGAEGYIWQGADTGFVDSLALSQEGNQLVAKSYLGAMFWDLNSGVSQPLDAGQYEQYWVDWSPHQEPAPVDAEQFQVLDTYRFSGPSTAVSNRKAFSACRTVPSAGGAPGCASLIYVFETGFNPLVTRLASCTTTAAPSDFSVELEGGLFRISGAETIELYSVALANKATNNGSVLAGVLYDPRHNWLVTASKVERHFSELALIVWDLDEKKQVIELFTPFEQGLSAAVNFSDAGAAVDVCDEFGTGIQVNLDLDSWRDKACKIAGRNLTEIEWRQFFGDKPKQQTCPQWP